MQSLKKHLVGRNFDLAKHTAWLNESEYVATFPLWNLSGELVGYQAYRPNASKQRKNDVKGRYYTYRGVKLHPKHSKTVAVWGLESWTWSNVLFITEGIFDACHLTKFGVSAVATLSNDPNTSLRNWLFAVKKMRPVVAVCDNDSAGRKLAKNGHMAHFMSDDKDLGDASDEYVKEMLSSYGNLF